MKTFVKLALFSLGIFLFSNPVNGQFMKWLIPESNGLLHLVDFSVDPPEVSVPNPYYGFGCGEEVNLITDANGEILFSLAGTSTSSIEVRNKFWRPMANGSGLLGHFSILESYIVPVPHSYTHYYIIYSNKVTYPGNLYYAIVDLSKNNGLGEVIEKNIMIGEAMFYEGKAVSHLIDGDFRWLLTTKRNDLAMEIVRYLITDDGVFYDTILDELPNCDALEIELSPDNTRFALAIRENSVVMAPDVIVYDFDLETGIISNKEEYSVTDQRVAGVEFSASSTKLYWRTNTTDNTCDLGRINFTNEEIHIIDDYVGAYGTGIEMAGNGRIYIAKSTNNNYHAEIANPDAEDIELIGYTRDGLLISQNGMRSGIPDAIDGEDLPIAIENFANINNFDVIVNISPNPSNDIVNISLSDNGISSFNCKLYDAQSRLLESYVLQVTGNTINSINVSNLQPGLYFLAFNLGNGVISKKIMVR